MDTFGDKLVDDFMAEVQKVEAEAVIATKEHLNQINRYMK